jgi:two-component system, NtrC family, response regulator AtoC
LVLRLQSYRWPGNIRELENLVKRYVVLGTQGVFDQAAADVATQNGPPERSNFDAEVPLDGEVSLKAITKQAVREIERQVIQQILEAKYHAKLFLRSFLSPSFQRRSHILFGIRPS